MSSAESDGVVVVGAGPVGLTAAAALAERGVAVTVVEAEADVSRQPRASTFHAPTLELLEPLGVVERLLERGLVADTYQHRDRQRGVVAEFDFNVLRDDTRFPFRLQCEQHKLCELLVDLLARHAYADVRFRTRMASFAQDDDGVRVEVQTPDGGETLRARYLVAADGPGSATREQLGISFDGMTYEHRYLVLLTDYPFEQALDDLALVNYVSDPEEYVVLLRSPDAWRVLFPVPPELCDEEVTDPERCQERLQGVVARDEPYEISHTQLYRVHQRVAGSFRDGRVLLVGDAAHVNSPIGGMGMNNGIHDAMALADVLAGPLGNDADMAGGAAVLHGGAELGAELDRWAEARRTVAVDYVRAITDRNTQALGERDEEARRRRQAELAATAADPQRAREWLLQASMLAPARAQGLVAAPARSEASA